MDDPGLLVFVLGAVFLLAVLSGIGLWRNHTSRQGR